MSQSVHRTQDNSSRSKSERHRGSAMVFAIFVLVLLAGMGVALLFMTRTEVKMSQADVRSKRAFYLAESGLEDGRATLLATNQLEDFSDDLVTAAGVDLDIDFDVSTVRPTFDSDGNVTGFTGYDDDVPLRLATTPDGGMYAAFLTNDLLETLGMVDKTDTNDRIMITAVGAGADKSFEIVQAVLEKHDVIPTVPPATITLLGPPPNFDGGSSNAKEYIGEDCNGAGIPGLYVPVVGTIGSSSEAAAETGVIQPGTYTSGPSYTGNDTAADLTDPSESTVIASGYGTIDSNWTDCQFLRDLADEMRYVADHICLEGVACTPPIAAPDRVLYVEGDYTIGPAGGSGTIFVTGSLIMDGRADWYGMIFVIGEGQFTRNGQGNGVISGAIMVADIAGPDDAFRTADDCTGPDNGFDQAMYDGNGGGNGDVQYCTNDLNPAIPVAPYDILDFIQR